MKTRTIKMRAGSTPYTLYQECKKLFPCWCWDEESLKSVKSDRACEKDYEIEVYDNIEADKDFKNISANELKEKGIIGITIEERLQMELDYFKETGKHLDIENITLCSGSRYDDGDVPFVNWGSGGRLFVYWCGAGSALGFLRARACIKNYSMIKLNNEKDKNKQGFNIICERCGLSVHI